MQKMFVSTDPKFGDETLNYRAPLKPKYGKDAYLKSCFRNRHDWISLHAGMSRQSRQPKS